jgi:hypothetical protein
VEFAIPGSLAIGSYSIGWNTEPSPTHVQLMRRQYPKAAPSMSERPGSY